MGVGVSDDVPVEHLDAAPHPGGDRVVVGDHDDRGAPGVEFLQQGQDGGARGRVQVAGRLVRHDQGGPADQGPGDRGALLLAAGQLVRPVPGSVAEPDPLDGRKLLVRTTPEGLALIDQTVPFAKQVSEQTYGGLNPAERVAIVYLLRAMTRAEDN